MSLLERLDKATVHFSQKSAIGRSSPFCYKWSQDDTRQLLEDVAKEIRELENRSIMPLPRTYDRLSEKLDLRK